MNKNSHKVNFMAVSFYRKYCRNEKAGSETLPVIFMIVSFFPE